MENINQDHISGQANSQYTHNCKEERHKILANFGANRLSPKALRELARPYQDRQRVRGCNRDTFSLTVRVIPGAGGSKVFGLQQCQSPACPVHAEELSQKYRQRLEQQLCVRRAAGDEIGAVTLTMPRANGDLGDQLAAEIRALRRLTSSRAWRTAGAIMFRAPAEYHDGTTWTVSTRLIIAARAGTATRLIAGLQSLWKRTPGATAVLEPAEGLAELSTWLLPPVATTQQANPLSPWDLLATGKFLLFAAWAEAVGGRRMFSQTPSTNGAGQGGSNASPRAEDAAGAAGKEFAATEVPVVQSPPAECYEIISRLWRQLWRARTFRLDQLLAATTIGQIEHLVGRALIEAATNPIAEPARQHTSLRPSQFAAA